MERNLNLDYFRLILSILVITIHTQPLFEERSLSGWLISNGIARIAVPCFFIISGYFIHTKLDSKVQLKRYLQHILLVYIVWSLIYIPTYYHTIAPRSLITFAVMGYYHLWYIPALIVGILILAILKKYVSDKIIISLAIFLFLTGYIMEINSFPIRTFCNGLFIGFPFVTLGYYIREKQIVNKIKNSHLITLLLVGFIALICESYLNYSLDRTHNLLLSLTVISPVLFICILKLPEHLSPNSLVGKLSGVIYYIHILVIIAIVRQPETFIIYKLPLIVVLCVISSIFIVYINKYLKILL